MLMLKIPECICDIPSVNISVTVLFASISIVLHRSVPVICAILLTPSIKFGFIRSLNAGLVGVGLFRAHMFT